MCKGLKAFTGVVVVVVVIDFLDSRLGLQPC